MDADTFEAHRRRLFAVAYRTLGSAAEAEDAVQETYLRWQAADPAQIASPQAWLTAVIVRHCVDQLRSAQRAREVYVGPWLPEPVRSESDAADPESLSLAFLVLLETLSPPERAAYLLREVFDYSHAEVAEIPRFAPSKEQHLRLLGGFLQAVAAGDLRALTGLLAADVVSYSDGGGKARAALRPVHGADAVARFMLGLARKEPEAAAQIEVADVNGAPALVQRDGARCATSSPRPRETREAWKERSCSPIARRQPRDPQGPREIACSCACRRRAGRSSRSSCSCTW
jgi:RNA polymerase sigma-70 factor (ECF subfamily)